MAGVLARNVLAKPDAERDPSFAADRDKDLLAAVLDDSPQRGATTAVQPESITVLQSAVPPMPGDGTDLPYPAPAQTSTSRPDEADQHPGVRPSCEKRGASCGERVTFHAVDEDGSALESRSKREGPGACPGITAKPNGQLSDEAFEKLAFFERVFFELDDDLSAAIDRSECESFLSFCLPTMEPGKRVEQFNRHDIAHDAKLSRLEFLELCVDLLWEIPMTSLSMAMENRRLSRKQQQLKSKKKWQTLADRIDRWCLVCVPPTYATIMLILFHVDLEDDYINNPNAPMFSGIAPIVKMSAVGVAYSLVPALIVAFISAGYLMVSRALAKKARLDYQRMRKELERPAKRATGGTRSTISRLSTTLSAQVATSLIKKSGSSSRLSVRRSRGPPPIATRPPGGTTPLDM